MDGGDDGTRTRGLCRDRRIREARLRSALAVNNELISLYWSIGKDILSRQEQEGWGAKIIDRLSADLHRDFPEMTGLSARNLKYMRAFAEAYPDQRQTAKEIIAANVKELIAQLEAGHSDALTAYLTAMSRFHNYSFGNVLEIARQRAVTCCYTSLESMNMRLYASLEASDGEYHIC